MRKGYARITAGLLMLSLAIGAMGCPVAARAEEDPIPGILNLDESIECAMKNDENLRLLEDNIDLMEDALEEATEVYWDYEGGKISGDSWSNLERAKINNRYYVIQAQADHDQAVAAYKDEKNRISYEATR